MQVYVGTYMFHIRWLVEYREGRPGQVGTIVELLAHHLFEVEFCDLVGNTIGFAGLCRHELLVLRHKAALAA